MQICFCFTAERTWVCTCDPGKVCLYNLQIKIQKCERVACSQRESCTRILQIWKVCIQSQKVWYTLWTWKVSSWASKIPLWPLPTGVQVQAAAEKTSCKMLVTLWQKCQRLLQKQMTKCSCFCLILILLFIWISYSVCLCIALCTQCYEKKKLPECYSQFLFWSYAFPEPWVLLEQWWTNQSQDLIELLRWHPEAAIVIFWKSSLLSNQMVKLSQLNPLAFNRMHPEMMTWFSLSTLIQQ